MRFSARRTKDDEKTGRRPRRRLVVAATAIAGALAIPALPATASAATQAPVKTTASAAGATCAASRPHSGTLLYAGIKGGMGTLTIKNGLSQDGVVVLVRGKSKAIGVYVRSHATTTVRNIKPGTYTIDFTTGSRFHVCTGRFARGAVYWRFGKTIPFVSPPYYTVATLTLHPVANGNTPVKQIKPTEFPAP